MQVQIKPDQRDLTSYMSRQAKYLATAEREAYKRFLKEKPEHGTEIAQVNFATGVIESNGVLNVAAFVKIRIGIESGHLVAEPIEQSFLSDGEWEKHEVRSQYQEVIVPTTQEFRDRRASQEKKETILAAIDRAIQSAVEEVTPLEQIAYVSLMEEALIRKAKIVTNLKKPSNKIQESIGTYSLKSLISNKKKRAEIINSYFNKDHALYITNKNITVFSLAA